MLADGPRVACFRLFTGATSIPANSGILANTRNRGRSRSHTVKMARNYRAFTPYFRVFILNIIASGRLSYRRRASPGGVYQIGEDQARSWINGVTS